MVDSSPKPPLSVCADVTDLGDMIATRKGYPLSGGFRDKLLGMFWIGPIMIGLFVVITGAPSLKGWTVGSIVGSLIWFIPPLILIVANRYLCQELVIYQMGVVKRSRFFTLTLRDEDVAEFTFAIKSYFDGTIYYLVLNAKAGKGLDPVYIRVGGEIPLSDGPMMNLRHRLALAGSKRILAELAEGRQVEWCQGIVLRPEGLAMPRFSLSMHIQFLSDAGKVIPFRDPKIVSVL